ncbi:hypothetical protein KP509_1Z169000 [Ceratopteris richardii]|nr:hypothetical protein KP509_1Z169000 [Ceratopteris richardii]
MKVSRKLSLKVEQLRSVIGKRFLLCHMDHIKQYIINSQNVFYLHERGAGGTSLSAGSRSVCLRCQRQLMDSANKMCYCSIECAWRARDVQIRCAFREREVSQDCAGQTLEMKCNEQQHQHTRKRPRKNAMPQRFEMQRTTTSTHPEKAPQECNAAEVFTWQHVRLVHRSDGASVLRAPRKGPIWL